MTVTLSHDPPGGRWNALIYVMLGRLLLLLVMLVSVATLSRFQNDDSAFFVFAALAFLITIPYALWLRHEERMSRAMSYQFVVDAILITGFIHFTGGIESQLNLLYPLIILGAGIIASGRLALQISLLSIFFYTTLVLLEMSGVLVHRGPGSSPYMEPTQVVQVLMLRILIFAMFAGASSYLADRCLLQDKQLQRLRVIANSILDNVGIPLIAVYEDGHVMLANPAAANMLQIAKDDFKGCDFGDFFPKAPPRLDDPADAKKLWKMKRRDGSLISVTFEATKGTFPAAVIGSLIEHARGVELYLVAVRDVTELLLAQEDETRLEERQRTAVDMVTEMAHVVRNPLSAIKGAGELLDTAVNAMFTKARQLTEDDWQTVRSMCDVIFEQTQELDEKVGYFMRCADQDRDELMKLVANADIWASKITKSGEEKHADHTSG